MSGSFSIQPIGRFSGDSQAVKRPKEIACFSYDDKHEFHLGDSSLKWYYPPRLGADLSEGFESFDKHDDSADEHLDSLLKTIIAHEQEEGKKIDAQVVTWRGMITKDCIFIEENHAYKQASKQKQQQQQSKPRRWENRGRDNQPPPPQFSPDVMTYWGYKFETLCTLPATWAETSREYIESRDKEVVSNKAQYCSVVRTGLGKTILCIGGEVDAATTTDLPYAPAVWDAKPMQKGAPTNWIELKTSASIRDDRGMANFERKLMKFWIQSFLLGVPRIIVGFRSQAGVLEKLEEIKTEGIPATAAQRGVKSWNANMCINFGAGFLDWLRRTINDDGVWRIRRQPRSDTIEVFQIEEAGHGKILTDEFINWRIKLSLMNSEGG
ncbi:uncharacterized protein JN550_006676 [Neoarthrinium moseri]|uniref:uncharacterized protein n=1 Tax=Neoarthrinium moseri TaxID=1658444 RepID=UPI001FDAD298|nr:uncharacterized protein JN550_006676 [Neoarthrinium moseri]KAI1867869.1 hypothetical protein JN550_006676 [Neoarthrinium moseri]